MTSINLNVYFPGRSIASYALYAIFCTTSNDFAVGYPVLTAIFGETHPSYPMYVYLVGQYRFFILVYFVLYLNNTLLLNLIERLMGLLMHLIGLMGLLWVPVLRFRIWIRIWSDLVFLGHPDTLSTKDPLLFKFSRYKIV